MVNSFFMILGVRGRMTVKYFLWPSNKKMLTNIF